MGSSLTDTALPLLRGMEKQIAGQRSKIVWPEWVEDTPEEMSIQEAIRLLRGEREQLGREIAKGPEIGRLPQEIPQTENPRSFFSMGGNVLATLRGMERNRAEAENEESIRRFEGLVRQSGELESREESAIEMLEAMKAKRLADYEREMEEFKLRRRYEREGLQDDLAERKFQQDVREHEDAVADEIRDDLLEREKFEYDKGVKGRELAQEDAWIAIAAKNADTSRLRFDQAVTEWEHERDNPETDEDTLKQLKKNVQAEAKATVESWESAYKAAGDTSFWAASDEQESYEGLKDFVVRKLGVNAEEFDRILAESHGAYYDEEGKAAGESEGFRKLRAARPDLTDEQIRKVLAEAEKRGG